MQHLGIYLHNHINKEQIVKNIFSNQFLQNRFTANQHGLLFAGSVIEQMIDKERKHDHYLITTATNKSLESMSSGEQKKALLQYLLQQKPAYIILDDWSGSLDIINIPILQQQLTQAATQVTFIQLFYRKQDLLPFIDEVLVVKTLHQQQLLSATEFINGPTTHSNFSLHQLPQLFESSVLQCNPLLQLNNVSVSYNERPILSNINWTVSPGEFWQLKGPNGTGKTTLVGMIIGDNPKGYGQDFYLFGRKKGSGESVWDIKKNIGYFYPAMTLLFNRSEPVINMILSGLTDSIGLYETPTEAQQLTAQAWLNILGPQYHNKRFNQLSAGEQRIVMVVRALVKLPPLLILDEPTAGLDDENTNIFIQLINAIAALKKIAIIYISHRHEAQVQPGKIIELIPGAQGSTAIIHE